MAIKYNEIKPHVEAIANRLYHNLIIEFGPTIIVGKEETQWGIREEKLYIWPMIKYNATNILQMLPSAFELKHATAIKLTIKHAFFVEDGINKMNDLDGKPKEFDPRD